MNRTLRRLAVAGSGLLATALLAACGAHTQGEVTSHDASGHASGSASESGQATFNTADVEFARNMITHDRQTAEMVQTAETRAENAQVKDLVARIKQAQEPEIALLSDLLRQWGQAPPPAASGSAGGGIPGMITDQEMKDLMAASGRDFDRKFLQLMIRHQQGAIEMAIAEQQEGENPRAKQVAGTVATDRAAEIRQMEDLLTRL